MLLVLLGDLNSLPSSYLLSFVLHGQSDFDGCFDGLMSGQTIPLRGYCRLKGVWVGYGNEHKAIRNRQKEYQQYVQTNQIQSSQIQIDKERANGIECEIEIKNKPENELEVGDLKEIDNGEEENDMDKTKEDEEMKREDLVESNETNKSIFKQVHHPFRFQSTYAPHVDRTGREYVTTWHNSGKQCVDYILIGYPHHDHKVRHETKTYSLNETSIDDHLVQNIHYDEEEKEEREKENMVDINIVPLEYLEPVWGPKLKMMPTYDVPSDHCCLMTRFGILKSSSV